MQLEYDLAEHILNNSEYFKKEIPEHIKSFIISSTQIPVFKEEFNLAYEEVFLSQIREYLTDCFNLNSEDANVIITKEFIEKLLGKDIFIYEYKN